MKRQKKLDREDPLYFNMYESMSDKLHEDLEAIEMFSKRNKRIKFLQKNSIDTIENNIKNCEDI